MSLNLTELIKLVKFIPIDNKNRLKYQHIIDKLIDSGWEDKEDLTKDKFKNVMKGVLAGKTPFSIPISVTKLTSWLQSKYFKHCEEK